jgi:hypothetical protein
MGQIKGNPALDRTPERQAYTDFYGVGGAAYRDGGMKPVMIDEDDTLDQVIDITGMTSGYVKDADLTDGSKNASFNTVAATSNGLGQNFKVGDDVWLGDRNVSNTMVISGIQEPTSAILQFGSGSQPSIAHLVEGAAFPTVGSAVAITGSLLMGHTGHLYIFNGGVSNGGWSQII